MKNVMVTYTGKRFDISRPERHKIDIVDIAHALSNLCRFNGHCNEFYSVAQHSLLVSQLVDPSYALAGLLHDAAEAYLGDTITPQKHMMGDILATVERNLVNAIAEKFGLPTNFNKIPEVTVVDRHLLVHEMQKLFRNWPETVSRDYERKYYFDIIPLEQRIAKSLFLRRFWSIFDKNTEM